MRRAQVSGRAGGRPARRSARSARSWRLAAGVAAWWPHSRPHPCRERTWRPRVNTRTDDTYVKCCDINVRVHDADHRPPDMYRWRGDASSLTCYIALAVCTFIAAASAGPLGPLPNVTSSELGLSEGSCAVGDVVYMPGDEFPGSSPCEKCSCSDGGVHCSKQRCEPRPGCKALHRPDHCCPTYQCECEQEGRVYGNGEKLVDPADPCLVCYCQGGEVVCRRIACFVRDDCRPRLVPGRCCPEYDNCPLRGVTSIPGVAPSMSSLSTTEDTPPTASKENIKQEITIKEITPVSEIPIITEVKIKEILPSPSIEVAEYSSSKSPLIPREATSEKSATNQIELTERPVVVEIHKPSTAVLSSLSPVETTASSESVSVSKNDDSTPSKFSFSTQDSINSEIYPSNVPSVPTMGSSETPEVPVLTASKTPVIIEEEDVPYDHNPAFPPLPDDLSELGNHEDEIIPEQNMDSEHVSSGHDIVSITSVITSNEVPTSSETPTKYDSPTTAKDFDTTTTTTTEKIYEIPAETGSTPSEPIIIASTEIPTTKENLMLNLRSAIPTEILNVPSFVPEEITGELDEMESTISTQPTPVASTNNNYQTTTVISTEKPVFSEEHKFQSTVDTATTLTPHFETSTNKAVETTELIENSKVIQDQTTSSIAKSNIPTEVTSQTEFSSLPIETSDQNPHEGPDNIVKDRSDAPTIGSSIVEPEPTKTLVEEPETVSKIHPTGIEKFSPENIETTEFVLTPLGSSESATDAVELIQISPDSDKSAAIIEPATESKKNSVLTELIKLVGDVASISDHTDGPIEARHVTGSTSISDSEELIPVNAGYKSKNNNYNLNSITEITPKSKHQMIGNKQKVIEIEDDDDGDSITDAPPPNDKIEPTTRRPIIDNVSDDMAGNKTDKTDIEIIKQAYVPNVERRPTKVVMEKNEKSISEEAQGESNPISLSAETATESNISVSSETVTSSPSDLSSEAGERIGELPKSTSSTSVQ